MKPLPLPVRVAAGLAVTAVDRARHLPEKLAELPVTMVSQALQLSMRVQQQVTELAIKGDDALSTLRPAEESPEWATFDEDAAEGDYDASADANSTRSRFDAAADEGTDADAGTEVTDDHSGDPWAAEEQAMVHELHHDDAGGPAALPDYPELTLPQVRARMRRLDVDQLTELVEFERAHGDRPAFVGMLTRRIGTLRDQQ
ncbi:MAG TPA: lipid droplet-associated protein [Pseudonocardiaceae bacterium]|nr:lipid droplet-associated protein [Pseudonocardiaceae bacterium]